ncbi:uncharacterized protein [Penaeus vannamei]|uniref:uncharacterized protein n=1 Tax=Penaeus vannamei TaxID=6689 RepID=UPI00387F9875
MDTRIDLMAAQFLSKVLQAPRNSYIKQRALRRLQQDYQLFANNSWLTHTDKYSMPSLKAQAQKVIDQITPPGSITYYTDGSVDPINQKGKSMLHLLEETPRIPTIRGSIKTHKEGHPVRPITNGTGSAPHRLAKKLAAPLSAALNSISGYHLSNTSDMMAKLQGTGMKCKKLVSFDVKSLFTNGAIKDGGRALARMDEGELPLQINDYIRLIHLCVEFGPFEFRGREYEQIQGLAMGSPLSAVLAQLFMETLEADHYRIIVGRNVVWLRYVGDIPAVVPTKTNLPDLPHRLNAVHPSIQFTIEEERNEQLPFLDTLIHRRPDGPIFLYREVKTQSKTQRIIIPHSELTEHLEALVGHTLR